MAHRARPPRRVSTHRARRTVRWAVSSDPSNPFAAPGVDGVVSAADGGTYPAWFGASVRRVVVMTMLSYGLYAVYWFERQYRYRQRITREDLWPLARGVFLVIFAADLFERIAVAASSRGKPVSWSATTLAALVFVPVVATYLVSWAELSAVATVALGYVRVALLAGALAVASRTVGELLVDDPDRAAGRFSIVEVLLVFFGAFAHIGTLGTLR